MEDAQKLNMDDIYPNETSVDGHRQDESEDTEESDDDFSTVNSAGNNEGNENKNANSDEDKLMFSKRDLRKIFLYSEELINKRSTSTTKRSSNDYLVAVKTESKEISIPPTEIAKIGGGQTFQVVSRKDYCVVTPEHIKQLKENQFSIQNRNVNEKLDILYHIMAETRLLDVVNGRRIVPVPKGDNTLGFVAAHVIRRIPHSSANFAVNSFLDDRTPFDHDTHTQLIAIGADDLMCYNADLLSISKVIKAAFDRNLQIWAQVPMKKGHYVEAFHSLVTKVHGTQQSDRKTAREALDKYVKFDSSEEIGLSLTKLSNLQAAVEYATTISLTEDEKQTKLNSLIFVDERIVLHTSLIDCIAKEYNYERTITQLIHVMKLLPLESQTWNIGKINKFGEKAEFIRYCFDFRDGTCKRGANCKFVHEIDPARKKKSSKGLKGTTEGKSEEKGIAKKGKPFKVFLSEADRKHFGKPAGIITEKNPQGWSGKQQVSINAMISTDARRGTTPSSAAQDGSQDDLYQQYLLEKRENQAGMNNLSNVQYSHHMNSLQVEDDYMYGSNLQELESRDMENLVDVYNDSSDATFQKRCVTILMYKSFSKTYGVMFILSRCQVNEMFPDRYVANILDNIWDYLRRESAELVFANLPDSRQDLTPDNFWYLSGEFDRPVRDLTFAERHCYVEGSEGSYHSEDSNINEQYYPEDMMSLSVAYESTMMNLINPHKDPIIDTGAGLSGTPDRSILVLGSHNPCVNMRVSGPFGPAITPDCQGVYGRLRIPMIVSTLLKDTLLSVSAICDGGALQTKNVAIFTSEGSEVYTENSVSKQLAMMRSGGDQIMAGYRKKGLYYAYPEKISEEIGLFLMNLRGPSIYDELHRVTGHGSKHNQQWHKRNSANANFTQKDEQSVRDICPACVRGRMKMTSTDHRREHRDGPERCGQQLAVDAYTHNYESRAGFGFADIVTDLASRRVHILLTKGRTSIEILENFKTLFRKNPQWFVNITATDKRHIKLDMEPGFQTDKLSEYLATKFYMVEIVPPRNKKANGVAERSVGIMEEMTNVAMLAPQKPVPQVFWDHAMVYAANTKNFNYSKQINTSPYKYETGNDIDIKKLHGFFDTCWVLIDPKLRDSKVGAARADRAYFLGYFMTTTQFDLYLFVKVTGAGKYGKVGMSKDLLFDPNLIMHTPVVIEDAPHDREFADPESYIPASFRKEAPVLLQTPQVMTSRITAPPIVNSNRVLRSKSLYRESLRQTDTDNAPKQDSQVQFHTDKEEEDNLLIRMKLEEPEEQYWYNFLVEGEHPYGTDMLAVVEIQHYSVLSLQGTDVPKSFQKAITHKDIRWHESIAKEQGKFESNHTMLWEVFTGQDRCNLFWMFTEKTDIAKTKKSRMVLNGKRLKPFRDYDPDNLYSGNVSATCIKMALTIAAAYKLGQKAFDLIGAYLVTPGDENKPIYVHTPEGYEHKPGHVLRVVGNCYGNPAAGKNFADTVTAIIKAVGFVNVAYDPKFWWMWRDKLPVILIIHSDNMKVFSKPEHISITERLLDGLRAAGYGIEDTSDELFVGVDIQNHADGSYTMNQKQAIDKLLIDLDMTGVKQERLPYFTAQQQPISLSKKDCLSEVVGDIDESTKAECTSFKYRETVGSLLYIFIHTVPQMMFILNVLSRFGTNFGPRHVCFMKHLLAYTKGIRFDELYFGSHDGATDIDTMTGLLQLSFWVDADLGGNLDNGRSQTCYMGFLGKSLICYASTTQGSLSTGTAESEVKAINHTIKAEVESCKGILEAMGFKQQPIPIYEDNQAAVFAARVPNMTKGLRHLDLNEMYFKEKQADNTIKVIKVLGTDNLADLGTKRVAWPIFAKIVEKIVKCKNSFFTIWRSKEV